MLNVTFLRHANSNFNSHDGSDFTRDISDIGIKKTKKIGRFLQNKKIIFDEILCSPALRTKKTLDIISVFFFNKPKIRYVEDLYYTSGKNLFEVLMLFAQKKKCMVISHEPLLSCSIESFFSDLKNPHIMRATQKYSTSSLFDVSFKCNDWFEINREIATINFFKKPNDLKL